MRYALFFILLLLPSAAFAKAQITVTATIQFADVVTVKPATTTYPASPIVASDTVQTIKTAPDELLVIVP